ncbi:MAG: class I SAM-dependent DNA methyltransferase [Clostridia bacterium]|nr:class I SAM-dependent DNA methyltransferase [Clostridia bacterium]
MTEIINNSKEIGIIWNSADEILRDIYKRHQYQDVILPFVVLTRIESVLIEKRTEIEAENQKQLSKLSEKDKQRIISEKVLASIGFDNKSTFTLKALAEEKETALKENFRAYINGYTQNIQDILQNFKLTDKIADLSKNKVLYSLVKKYSSLSQDLSPKNLDNLRMGYIFEELIRRFAEASNEEAGEHFTPREIIELMVELTIDDDPIQPGELKRVYDPACGSGGMLTIAKNYIQHKHPKANIVLYGQEINPETYAICASDMLLKGEKPTNIKHGNTLTDDKLLEEKFDYMLSNPPYGKDWKKDKPDVEKDTTGRFNKDMLPRISDGQTLFLQQMLSKMKTPQEGGSTIAIVFNGSPLFTGDAGSGESNFRKHLLENDLVDAIIALPEELFYNTGIATYIWLVRNKKENRRKGKVQLINATTIFKPMKKSLGKKRNYIEPEQIKEIAKIHQEFKENEYCKIFDNTDFGYTRVSLELSELDEKGKPLFETITKKVKGKEVQVKQEIKTKDDEYVPLKDNIEQYLKKEVEKPYKILDQKVGYEINFTQYFYKYNPLRTTEDIAKDITKLEKQSQDLLKELGLLK